LVPLDRSALAFTRVDPGRETMIAGFVNFIMPQSTLQQRSKGLSHIWHKDLNDTKCRMSRERKVQWQDR
jgi:hypothetical protein